MLCTASYNSLIYGFLDQLRAYWKYLQAHSPILGFVKSCDDTRLKEDVFECGSRQRASSEDKCKAYHQSIAYNRITKEGVFQYHLGKSKDPKPLVVLCMGNGQEHHSPENTVGMLKLYNKLSKRDDVDVLLCRVGSSTCAINHRLGLARDSSLHPDLVLSHVKNLIEDRNCSRGVFADQQKPSKVILAGYSWGGGAVKEITNDWQHIGNGLKIPLVVTLDAISHGLDNLGDELTERPQHAEKVVNIYQNNDAYLNGSTLSPKLENDFSASYSELREATTDHKSIDDDPWIMEKVFKEIDAVIRRCHPEGATVRIH